MAQLRIGCVVMAAGNARRFGENKLAVQVQGKALFHRALEAVPAEQFVRTVVVSQYPEVLELAHRMGFVPVPNRHPDWGISHTISLGLGKLPEMDAALFQVADQPLLRRESVGSLVDFYREHPEHIAALGHGGVRGNPCLFPARLFPELLALQGAVVSGPIPLPTHKGVFTVNRSTFVNKKSREQFLLCTFKRLIDIYSSTTGTIDALMKLELPSGVEVEIKV